MARIAHREGYPEIGLYWEKAAWEEAEHAAKFAELLGEIVSSSTKGNLEKRVAAEHGANAIIIKRYFDEDADNNLPVSLAAYLVRYLDAVSEEDKNKMDEFARKIQIERRENQNK